MPERIRPFELDLVSYAGKRRKITCWDGRAELESLARRLSAVDGRVDVRCPVRGYTSGSCDACGEESCVASVRLHWSPRGSAGYDHADVGAACAEEFLRDVVVVECGDPDLHTDRIDVEIRRALR